MDQSTKTASRPGQAAARKPRSTKKQGKRATRKRGRSSATKTAVVLKRLKREQGATLEELMRVTGWQAHSVRGFLAGKVKNGLGLPLRSEATEKGRRYWIEPDESTPS